jgi:ubiquinone/menaquinone biosynthesis C-methylase UbiE
MKILNLGCGTKVSSNPDVINIDWSIYLRLKKNPVFRVIVPLLLKDERLKHFNSLSDNIVVHNLAKGIPFPSNSVDAVYHSHLFEHLDRDVAKAFLIEVKRVLKHGGIHRIVVPDLEKATRAYIAHISNCQNNFEEANKHDSYVASIIEQSVRREAFGTSQQKPIRKFIENVFLGDARRRGETHQWMYDKINLSVLLVSCGYNNPQSYNYNTSQISDWNKYGLDLDEHGNEYKPESMYIETRK